MKNDFGDDVFEIKDVLKDPGVLECVKYEKETHRLLEEEGVTEIIPQKLTSRAEIIFNQIKDFLEGERVLDIGCGDGKVGELISKMLGLSVDLTDIYEHGHIRDTRLEFKLMPKDRLPYEKDSCDTSLLITVLHHSEFAAKTFREAVRVTKPEGKIIVIESVFAPKPEGSSDAIERAGPFLKLSPEQHRKANMFFDHFYNRCIHYSEDPKKKVTVPFNFKTPEGWKVFFEKEGTAQEKIIHLAIDQPTVPEYHTLHVLRVKK